MNDFDIAAVSDDWEALADAGRAVMEHMDTGRWLAGDLALRVETRYGTNAIGKYASEIGIARASTLRDYLRVARFYEPVARATYHGALSWTHYRLAMRAGDLAGEWLERANDNGWPVAELDRAIKAALGQPVPPRKLFEGTGMMHPHGHGATIYVDAEDVPAGMERQRVTVKVYEAEVEEEGGGK